jgi:uncharacterized protein (TIGR02246 family)
MEVSMRILFCSAACLLLAASMMAQTAPGGPAEEAAIRAVVKSYVDARENRDTKAVAALFTPDADQLVSTGEWRRGRDTLVRGAMGSSERNPGSRTITADTIRFLTSDVAIADGPYIIAATGGGAERRMWATFVLQRGADGWRIAAIRNMFPTGQASR